MAHIVETGELQKIPFIQQIEWRIPDFFTTAEDGKYLCLASSTFPVTGVLWHLRFYPKDGQLFLSCKAWQKDSNSYLASDAHRECSLAYEFGLKRSNGTVLYIFDGIVKENESRNNDKCNFITKLRLSERKSELVPGNVLTIICTMKWEPKVLQSSTQPETKLDSKKTLKLIRLDKLSENFKDLFGDKETCDTTLVVKDKEFKAHRSVLIARSSIFAATFRHDTLERQTGVITITDCDPDSFAMFLEYVYCGKLEDISCCNALNLYYTSDKYDMQELKTFCIDYLMQHLTVENICEIATFADTFDNAELFSAVQDFFTKNMQKIFVTPEWVCFLKKENHLANKLLIEMSNTKK